MALVHSTFEHAGTNREVEFSEKPALHRRAYGNGRSCRSSTTPGTFEAELKSSRESLDTALMGVKESISTTSSCQSKVNDSREAHDVVCLEMQAAGTRGFEMKRKADDARTQSELIGVDVDRRRRCSRRRRRISTTAPPVWAKILRTPRGPLTCGRMASRIVNQTMPAISPIWQ